MKNRLLPTIKGYRILDRYILGKFLSTYLFGLAIIIVIVVVFDYTEKVDDFTETKASHRRWPRKPRSSPYCRAA